VSDSEVRAVEVALLPICGAPGCAIVARPDQTLCDDHAVQQRVLAARRKLAEHAPMAADELIDICAHADSADVRRRAAEAILDRVGVRPGVELDVTTSARGVDPSQILRARLDVLRQRTIQGLSESTEPLEIGTSAHRTSESS
jgi:hypothetical protein